MPWPGADRGEDEHVERAGQPGERAGEHERLELHRRGRARRGRRRPARCRGCAIITRPGARRGACARTTSDGQRQRRRGRSRSAPTGSSMSKRFHSTGGTIVVGHEVGEVDGVEEVRVEGDGERDRGDGQVEAADAQRRAGRWRRRRRAPTTIAAAMATNRSTFQRVSRLPAAMAPTPTMPNWPRLMLPPQPVSTTSDMATRPHTSGEAQRGHRATGVSVSGTSTTTQRRRPRRAPRRRPAHLGHVAQLARDRLEHAGAVPAALARLGPGRARPCASSRATRITTRNVTSKIDSAVHVPADRPLGDAEADAAGERDRAATGSGRSPRRPGRAGSPWRRRARVGHARR